MTFFLAKIRIPPIPPPIPQIRAYTKTDCHRISSLYPGRNFFELGKFVVAPSTILPKTPSKSISDVENEEYPTSPILL